MTRQGRAGQAAVRDLHDAHRRHSTRCKQHLAEHLAYQKDLEARGITFAAGPFADDSETDWSGEGMIIVRAASVAEATAIAQADPMHRSGVRRFRVRPVAAQRRLVHRDGALFGTAPFA